MKKVISCRFVQFDFICRDWSFSVAFERAEGGWNVITPKMEFWFSGVSAPSSTDAFYYAEIVVRQLDGVANDVIKGE